MPKTIHYAAIDGCMILVHNDCALDTDEFMQYLQACNEMCEAASSTTPLGVLVFTDGVGPTARQRALMRETFSERARATPCSVLTPSPLARGIVTALSWLGLNLKAFEPVDVFEAFKFIDAPAENKRGEALRKIVELRAQFIGPQIASNAFDSQEILTMTMSALRVHGARRQQKRNG